MPKNTSLVLSSSAFAEGSEIPRVYTCEGRDISPPLSWSGVPHGTRSFALVMDDPDAPDPAAPKRVWVHWLVYNLPGSLTHIAEAVTPSDLPAGTLQGLNDWNRPGYGGACPPIGRHRYFHKLYALDVMLPDLGAPDKAKLLAAMEGHVLAQAILIGTYKKRG